MQQVQSTGEGVVNFAEERARESQGVRAEQRKNKTMLQFCLLNAYCV